MNACRIEERETDSFATDSPVYRYLLPGMGARSRDARDVRVMRGHANVPTPVRLTTRGKCVAVIAWVGVAWTLALVLPYWWLRF